MIAENQAGNLRLLEVEHPWAFFLKQNLSEDGQEAVQPPSPVETPHFHFPSRITLMAKIFLEEMLESVLK